MKRDKSGGWHGRFGKVVYLIRNAKQCIRDFVKCKDPKTARQMLHRELTREVGRLHIAAMVVNAAIRGISMKETGAFSDIPDDFYIRLLESNQLALTCGWLKDEPMLLYADDMFLNRKHLHLATIQELIWADAVGDKICGVAFAPRAPKGFFRLALRIKSQLAYKSANSNWQVAGAVEIEGQENPSPDSLKESLAGIPEFCRQHAAEFISKTFGNSPNEFSRNARRGYRVVYFELTRIPVPASIFGVEYAKIADLSGGRLHLLIDLVGMTRFKRGEFTAYQCVRSKPSKAKSDYIINIPKRHLGKFGKALAIRLYRKGRAHRKKYFSNLARRLAKGEFTKEWKQEHLERVREYDRMRYQRVKEDQVKYARRLAAGRKACKKWRAMHPEKGREYNRSHREKVRQDPVKYAKQLAYLKKWRKEHPEKVKEYNRRHKK